MARKKLSLANNPLLSGPSLAAREDNTKGGVPYRELKLNSIERDSNQPRVNFDEEKLEELRRSIEAYGVLTPIIVRPSRVRGRYTLIAGERRLRAAALAKLPTIPAIVDQQADDGKGRTLAVQLVENLQRADLTPIERAHAIGALKERYELSVRQIADKLGVSKSMVQRSLDILDLPDDLLNALREGASESKVLLLAKVTDQALRTKYLGDLDSVTRDQIQGLVKPKAKGAKAKRSVLSPEDMRIADEIQRALGMRVTMSRSNTSADDGKLVIQFYSDGDLQEVFRRLVSAT